MKMEKKTISSLSLLSLHCFSFKSSLSWWLSSPVWYVVTDSQASLKSALYYIFLKRKIAVFLLTHFILPTRHKAKKREKKAKEPAASIIMYFSLYAPCDNALTDLTLLTHENGWKRKMCHLLTTTHSHTHITSFTHSTRSTNSSTPTIFFSLRTTSLPNLQL